MPADEMDAPPTIVETDVGVWSDLVEVLSETLLEDYDFSMEDKFLDMPPEAAEKMKKDMNIDPNYFVAVPDDPAPARLAAIREELRLLFQ